MNLLWHQLKKDLLRTRLLVVLWLFFSLLRFALAAVNVNPGDMAWQTAMTLLSPLTMLAGSLLVMILVPVLIQQEPLVGTTAFWLTRPISRRLLLAEKSLFLLGLILLPLFIQSVIMLASGVTPRDTLLAAPEFLVGELAWFLTMAMIAALTPGFGRFVIVSVLYLVFSLVFSYLFLVLHLFGNPLGNEPLSFIASRGLVSSLFTIGLCGAAIFCQFFWRRFGVAVALAVVAIVGSSILTQVWPVNFFRPSPDLHPDPAFDADAVTLKPQGTITSNEQVNFRGAEPDKQYNANFNASLGAPGFLLQPQKFDVTLTTASGDQVPVKPPAGVSYFWNSQPTAALLQPILGDVPVVNLNSSFFSTWPLFTVTNAIYQRYAHAPAKLSMQAHMLASKYVATDELPIRKGAEFRRGSYHEVITDILHQADGVDILLQIQDVRLNYHLRPDQDISLQPVQNQVVYLLVNRARREAVMQKQNTGLSYVSFTGESDALQHTPKRVAFGPENNNSAGDFVFPKIDDAWLRDAVLMRIELQPVAEFVKPLLVGDFRLDGQYATPGLRFEPRTPDLDTLAKITLPPDATRAQVRDYIAAIIAASQYATGAIDEHDPQVGMLEQVGAENIDLLVAVARDTHNYYLNRAIDHLAQPDQKAMIIADLPTNVDLISVIVHHGWQADARDVLIAGLDANKGDPNFPRPGNQPFSYIPPQWIQAVAGFRDPATYPALHDYFVNHDDSFTYRTLATLPGFDAAQALKDAWTEAQASQGNARWRVGNLLPLAAQAGFPDVPATLLKLLSETNGSVPYPRQVARKLVRQYTPAVGKTDDDLIAWLKANAAHLVFDPAQKKYVLAAAPPAPANPAPVNAMTPASMSPGASTNAPPAVVPAVPAGK